MRGKVPAAFCHNFSPWITPAYAGKSRPVQIRSHRLRDHPRLCGEKNPPWSGAYSNLGSPPPMRGKVFISSAADAAAGITPAYAGKSYGVCGALTMRQDHPRLCGEKLGTIVYLVVVLGSPPPMRGKDSEESLNSTVFGITPAYAGKRA